MVIGKIGDHGVPVCVITKLEQEQKTEPELVQIPLLLALDRKRNFFSHKIRNKIEKYYCTALYTVFDTFALIFVPLQERIRSLPSGLPYTLYPPPLLHP